MLSVLWLHIVTCEACVLCLKPKHVGAVFLVLKCFNTSTILTLCASLEIKVLDIVGAWCNHEV